MKFNKKGFTMIELLVVLLIIGVLAAVAAPLYLKNLEKARVSEAVGAMSLMRQVEKEYFSLHSAYLDVASPDIEAQTDAVPPGLGVTIGATQYFSAESYSIATGTNFTDGTAAADFVITATGSLSAAYAAGVGARNRADVTTYIVEMDNSGRTVYSIDSGANWKPFTN